MSIMTPPDRPTPDAIRQSLIRPKPVPSFCLKLFGEANVAELLSILRDPAVVDIDTLSMAGYLTDEEFDQYLLIVPEFQEIRLRLRNLARKFVEVLKPKIPHYFGITFPRGQRRNFRSGIPDLIFSFNKLVLSQDISEAPYRTDLLATFHAILDEYFTLALHEYVNSSSPSEQLIGDFLDLFDVLDRKFFEILNMNFPGSIVAKSIGHYMRVADRHPGAFSRVIGSSQGAAEELAADADRKFQRIADLSQFRKITFTSEQIGNQQLHLYGDEHPDASISRISYVCMIRVVLDPSVPFYPPTFESVDGGGLRFTHVLSPAALEFYLDRASGALLFPTTHTSIEKAILSKRDYQRLRNRVFDFLLRYLESKEDDIDEAAHSPLPLVIAEIRGDAAEVLTVQDGDEPVLPEEPLELDAEAVPEPVDLIEDAPMQEVIADTPSAPVESPPLATEGRQRRHGVTDLFAWRLFFQFSGNEIKRALVSILGQPLRNNGSHFVFRCRDGSSFAISFHGSESMNPGFLRKCLRKFGVTPQELYDRL